MKKIIRISTVPISLDKLLEGQLRFLNQHFEVIAVSSPLKQYLGQIGRREGVHMKSVPMKRGISPLNDIKSLFQLIQLFSKEKPQIVHSITPKAGLLSMLAAKITGVPVRIHTFTGLIFPTRTGKVKQLLIAMDKLLCNSATHIYPEGEGVKRDLLDYKITTKPLHIIANGNVNGVNTNHFNAALFSSTQKASLRHKLNIDVDDFVFVFVGRLVGDKGINELVKAFQNSKFKTQNSKLLLVGPQEPDLDPLQPSTLQEIDKNPNIISVGYQEDVRPYLAISDALVFPSYREGFPNVVMQAGAMGLPCIVSDINGCNEIIVDGENGLIIPSKNREELQIAMKFLVDDRDLYTQLQKNARNMIVSRYQREEVWQALLEEYQTLLKEKGLVE